MKASRRILTIVTIVVVMMTMASSVFARGCYDDSDYDYNQNYDCNEDVVDDYEFWEEEDIIDCDDSDSEYEEYVELEDWQECDLEDDPEQYEEYGDITVGRHDYCDTVYMTAIVNVTVRSGPGTQYTPIDCIYAGQKVGIIGEGPGHDGGRSWYITEDGGYVIAGAFTTEDYSPEEEEEAARAAAADTYVVEYYDTVCVDANVRSGPGKSYPVVDGVSKGTRVGICYEESGWYYTDRGGWIAAYLFDEDSCASSSSSNNSCKEKKPNTCAVEYYDIVCVDANVRKGPGKSYQVIDGVSKGSRVGICYEENGWYYTDRGGWIAAYLFDEDSCASSSSKNSCEETSSYEESSCKKKSCSYGDGDTVVVSIEDQMVYVYKNGECVYSTSCVTGKSGCNDTPKGEYQIYEKSRNTVLEDEEGTYHCPVDYWMPFYEGYGLHDASWRECFGGETYIHDGSHGCVNMDDSAAEFIYNNCSVGTKVIVE